MGLVINTNIASLVSARKLTMNTNNLNRSMEKLASGYRINRAADDAAGLGISETLRGQIRGNKVAINNTQDGINILQIAEGALSTISENLQRIRELTIQAANDTNSSNERRAIAMEVQQRLQDINRIANTTRGSNVQLLDGTSSTFRLQIGSNAEVTTNTINIGELFVRSTSTAIGIPTSQNITATAAGVYGTGSNARTFIDYIDSAIANVSGRRSKLGAYQNRLEATVENLSINVENLMTTESRIRNVDLADETAAMAKYQILQQASVNVLSKANQSSQLALQLLQ